MPERDFEKLLLEAVDEGLSSLGESSKQSIYYHLEKSFHIKKQEIPYKVEAFVDAIEKIFGFGANFLEILIMKQLYEKVGRSFKWRTSKDLKFAEYVDAVRRSFLEKTSEKTVEFVQCEEMVMES